MRVSPNSPCPRQEWRMRIGVVGFVLCTWVVAIAERDFLWALWGLWGVVPLVMVCRLPPDVRQRVSRFFPP